MKIQARARALIMKLLGEVAGAVNVVEDRPKLGGEDGVLCPWRV